MLKTLDITPNYFKKNLWLFVWFHLFFFLAQSQFFGIYPQVFLLAYPFVCFLLFFPSKQKHLLIYNEKSYYLFINTQFIYQIKNAAHFGNFGYLLYLVPNKHFFALPRLYWLTLNEIPETDRVALHLFFRQKHTSKTH